MSKTKELRIRWFNDACYEITLPNGKGILIDPYIDESKFKKLDSDCVEHADYILISHTHFDHFLDLAKIADRFDSQIFVGQGSGMELAKCYDVAGYRMNFCSPGEHIATDDFELQVFRGKHTKLGDFDRPAKWPENIAKDGLDPKTIELNMWGSYEYMIYLLTLPSNFRILIWGGGADTRSITQAKEFAPDVAIAQLPRESTDAVAQLYAAIGGRVIFPHHHDFFIAQGEPGMKVISETIEKTKKLALDTLVISPEKGKWYRIQTSVELDEE